MWAKANGPVSALVFTLEAVGWDWISAAVMVDDLGHEWDMRQDPPAAVQRAMQETTRRMRVKQLGEIFPHLIPAETDISISRCVESVLFLRYVCDSSEISFWFGSVLFPLTGFEGNVGP